MQNLEAQLTFIRELDKLKGVYRLARVKTDENRRENSAEHSWHLCLIAHVLLDYVDGPVDINKVIRLLLVHDIVEIDAGDTFAFAAQSALDEQPEKELRAAKRLFGLLPKHQGDEFLNLWLEFERRDSLEARYAVAIDRVAPLIMNVANDGGSWRHHTPSRSQVLKRNEYIRIAVPRLWDYVVSQIDFAISQGWLSEG
jgi:putative hydrolase of HD superfamily